MRLPQTGQSFRSFCDSWSHQLQNRRFSTVQGSSDGVGASGISSPTTSSGSPVSRSRYSWPGSGFDDDFSTGGGRPHPVLLAGPHCGAMLPAAQATASSGTGSGGAGMPRAWIECGPERMVRAVPRPLRSLLALAASAVALVGLGGCAIKHPTSNVVQGKVSCSSRSAAPATRSPTPTRPGRWAPTSMTLSARIASTASRARRSRVWSTSGSATPTPRA